jgi:N-acyl amino acid synthase of PEP-CTERM/exosortase system
MMQIDQNDRAPVPDRQNDIPRPLVSRAFMESESSRLAIDTATSGVDHRFTKIPISVFALRYEVYCLDCGFLSADDHPEGLERDEFDDISAHFCALDTQDKPVGYVRLVPADPEEGSFPFQSHCESFFDPTALPNSSEAVEISRLIVHRNFRRRCTDITGLRTGADDPPPLVGERRSNSPDVLLNLYRQIYQYSRRNGIRYWYAAMERTLARALAQFKFNFTQIGPVVDYYGPVAPYMADLRELECRLEQCNPALLAWMQKPVLLDD